VRPAQSTIHRWLAQYDAEVRGEHVIGTAPITADQRRIRELEEQNKRLQEDVAILKKATAFFVKQMR
jgi:transposase